MFTLIINNKRTNIEISNIENITSFEQFQTQIQNTILKSLGEYIYIDVGNNREPNYIEKKRKFKSKYWKNIKIKSFNICGNNIILDFSDDLFENLKKIYQYSKDNEYKIIWQGAGASL